LEWTPLFGILVYIAVGSSISPRQGEVSPFLSQQDNQTIISQQARIDAALHDQISSPLDYVHNATIDIASLTVLLSGLNLSQNQFILLYDSTSYASKGHIALSLPCDSTDPSSPLFQVLVGRAPDIIPTRLGYIEVTCGCRIYHLIIRLDLVPDSIISLYYRLTYFFTVYQ
jgi:hypothetical protein